MANVLPQKRKKDSSKNNRYNPNGQKYVPNSELDCPELETNIRKYFADILFSELCQLRLDSFFYFGVDLLNQNPK